MGEREGEMQSGYFGMEQRKGGRRKVKEGENRGTRRELMDEVRKGTKNGSEGGEERGRKG